MFYFDVTNTNVIPVGVAGTGYTFDNDCAPSNSKGYGCAAWLIQVGNMDYLHCSGLSLTGKHTCK